MRDAILHAIGVTLIVFGIGTLLHPELLVMLVNRFL